MPRRNSVFENNITRLIIRLRKHEVALLLAGVVNVRLNQLFLVKALT